MSVAAKILVIDDDSKNLQVVLEAFRSHPHEILHAPGGSTGLQVVSTELPDIILLDWAMPEMSGIEVIHLLKADPATSEIPVIMTTGIMTSSADLKEALEAGATDFVRKPYDNLELISRVQATLRHSFTERQNKELLEKELEQKERELSLMAMQAYEKNKFLSELENQLRQLRQRPVDASFSRIFKEIRREKNDQGSWDSFSLHFQKVHPHFFTELKTSFPELTTNDLRISSYIKIGMSNKEIAQVVGVEAGTVKTNMHRLKKKLNLTADDSLRDFVLAL